MRNFESFSSDNTQNTSPRDDLDAPRHTQSTNETFPVPAQPAGEALLNQPEPQTFHPDSTKNYEVEPQNLFAGEAIFSDIDGTITDNSGEISPNSIATIKDFINNGGQFIPVTGRARFESVADIVEKLYLPFVIINNGAEIFDHDGNRIFASELTNAEIEQAFAVADKYHLTWMQNKKNPATGEEYLFSNFTEASEQAMQEVGIVDTVRNEEGRIGLTAKLATADEVMSIPGQNYKIQMMSPDSEAIKSAYRDFQELGIPCILNMQSSQTGEYHWVEVIRGTKTSGIQTLINEFLPGDVENITTMGDGGNDIPMLTAQFTNRSGEPVKNRSIAVGNASEKVRSVTTNTLSTAYNKLMRSEEADHPGLATEVAIRAIKFKKLRQARLAAEESSSNYFYQQPDANSLHEDDAQVDSADVADSQINKIA